LPYWHMYGADLCMTALSRGLPNYIIDGRINHFSATGSDDGTLRPAVEWFYQKWRKRCGEIEIFRTMTCEVNFATGNCVYYL